MAEYSDPLGLVPFPQTERQGYTALALLEQVIALDPSVEAWPEAAEARQWRDRGREIEAEVEQLASPDVIRQLQASAAIQYAEGIIGLGDVLEVARRTDKPGGPERRLAGEAVRHCGQRCWSACNRPRDAYVGVLRPLFEAAAAPLSDLAQRIPSGWRDGTPAHGGRTLDVALAELAVVVGALDNLWTLADALRGQRMVRIGPPMSAHEYRWETPHLAPVAPGAPGWAVLAGFKAGAVPTIATWAEVEARQPPEAAA